MSVWLVFPRLFSFGIVGLFFLRRAFLSPRIVPLTPHIYNTPLPLFVHFISPPPPRTFPSLHIWVFHLFVEFPSPLVALVRYLPLRPLSRFLTHTPNSRSLRVHTHANPFCHSIISRWPQKLSSNVSLPGAAAPSPAFALPKASFPPPSMTQEDSEPHPLPNPFRPSGPGGYPPSMPRAMRSSLRAVS